jgi:tripartite-type tricarboxylate transporter receptor subunit TctC
MDAADMMRGHRRFHRRVWLVLAPLLAALVGVAVDGHVEATGNDDWPVLLVVPAAAGGR